MGSLEPDNWQNLPASLLSQPIDTCDTEDNIVNEILINFRKSKADSFIGACRRAKVVSLRRHLGKAHRALSTHLPGRLPIWTSGDKGQSQCEIVYRQPGKGLGPGS